MLVIKKIKNGETMRFYVKFLAMVSTLFFSICSANELYYGDCKSLEEVINRETQEINSTDFTDANELAQLYVARGESYLLCRNYRNAIKDFQNSYFYLEKLQNFRDVEVIAFRIAFGEAVSYDNLNMQEKAQIALQQLQVLANHIGCDDCIEDKPCQEMIKLMTNSSHLQKAKNLIQFCKRKEPPTQQQEGYDDILGPNQVDSSWCQEVIVGTGRAMDAIACLAPSHLVKITLIGVIEALITRGVKCCQAGGFWKACVAPITRKWREWNKNKERHVLPNEQNLPNFTN